ncbi:hypothetical protein D9M71_693290 [compost metagenome]
MQLEVPVVVPGQGAHAGAGCGIQDVEDIGQAACPGERLAVVVAVHVAVGEQRNDLGVGRYLERVPHDGGDPQVEIHHHALHRQPPALFLFERRGRPAGWPGPRGRVGAMAVPICFCGFFI